MTLQEFLTASRRLLVITGAGCSTASGIGDYRDERGEWKRPAPIQHQDFMRNLRWRQRYWARSQAGYPEFMKARPNVAHHVLASWERSGRLCGLITQNVDRLHQRAGHDDVIDLHGRLDQVVCMECGLLTDRALIQAWLNRHNRSVSELSFSPAPDGDADLAADDFSHITVPECEQCGGVLKPNVVFFGDSVPKPVVAAAFARVEQADGVLIVGSSLMVYSSFRFVRRAAELGLPIAAINVGRTRADDLLCVKEAGDCSAVLQQLAQ